MQNNLIYSQNIIFNQSDFCGQNLLPNSVFKVFENIATAHANVLGVGYENMIEKNLFWVVMRVKYRVDGTILPNQKLLLKTVPQTSNMFEFDRDFFVEDENGKILLRGTSKWCVVDATTRRLAKMNQLNVPVALQVERAFETKFLKTEVFVPDFSPDYVYTVLPADIDANGHMNNSVYAKIVFDCLHCPNKKIETFQLNFLSEAFCGGRLDVYKKSDEKQTIIVGKKCEAENSFSAFVTFKRANE